MNNLMLNVNNLRTDFENAAWDICNIFEDVDDIIHVSLAMGIIIQRYS